MATTSSRNLQITFSGDTVAQIIKSAADNAASPAQEQLIDLASGANTITVPTAGGATAKSVTIIPPSANAVVLTLKGVTGDTGIAIGLTDPTTIALNAVSSFVINAASSVVGVQLIWT